MEVIKVENLSTIFGTNVVHDNISFGINKKEIFGVLGGSGSGKSVLVKQIVMLNKIQTGTIKIFDKDISKINLEEATTLKQEFSYLFQFGALFSFLTVIENIAVLLKEYTNLPADLIEKIAYTNLEIVGLPKNCANLYPSEISGGMKKRVAFARCLALQPKILFLDEPTSGLDPASTQMINELILYLRDTFDMTIVVITHDLTLFSNLSKPFSLLYLSFLALFSVNDIIKVSSSFFIDET